MKNKLQKIKFPVLRSGIMVCYDYDYTDEGLAFTTVFSSSEANNPIIHFNAKEAIECPVVVHEVIHAVRNVLTVMRGVKPESIGLEDDEFLNYYCDYTFNEIIKFCINNKIETSIVSL